MKYGACYHTDEAVICERCGMSLANVVEVIDDEGQTHNYGHYCAGIVMTQPIYDQARSDYEAKRAQRKEAIERAIAEDADKAWRDEQVAAFRAMLPENLR